MKQNNIHFIGIGGIGMSGLAEIMLSRGKRVTGSDVKGNALTERLKGKGAVIFEGHASEHLPEGTELVIRSSCIRRENPEIKEAELKGISVMTRGELLKEIMENSPLSVGVTGTHGKTTTSSMIAHIMENAGVCPTSIIGGTLEILGSNARDGKGGITVAEVDESDGFFRNMSTGIAVITNIEREHMENYGSMGDLLSAYKEFIGRIYPGGTLIYSGEDAILDFLSRDLPVRTVSFGIGGRHNVSCRIVTCAKSIEIELYVESVLRGMLKSPLIGKHNVKNMLAAYAACSAAGMPFADIAAGFLTFRGAGRRFEKIGKVCGVEVIEDYAHHPTELSAVIRAAKNYSDGRVVAVFQPHRHSRTSDLAEDFVNCFDGSDFLILTDVYSAHEDPVKGLGIRDIFDRIDRSRFREVALVSKEFIPDRVSDLVREGDTVLVLGAGDIREISPLILNSIKHRLEPVPGERP